MIKKFLLILEGSLLVVIIITVFAISSFILSLAYGTIAKEEGMTVATIVIFTPPVLWVIGMTLTPGFIRRAIALKKSEKSEKPTNWKWEFDGNYPKKEIDETGRKSPYYRHNEGYDSIDALEKARGHFNFNLDEEYKLMKKEQEKKDAS